MTPKWEKMTGKEREAYINQDCCQQYEYIPKIPLNDPWWEEQNIWQNVEMDWGVKIRSPQHLTQLIILLHTDGKTTSEIAYHLPCSKRYIRRVKNKFKKSGTVKICNNLN